VGDGMSELENVKANTALVEAATELLAECETTRKKLLAWEDENMATHPGRPFAHMVCRLGAAIAKARGEEHD